MKGDVEIATAKLLSQLEEPPMETPFALIPSGNTSDTMIWTEKD